MILWLTQNYLTLLRNETIKIFYTLEVLLVKDGYLLVFIEYSQLLKICLEQDPWHINCKTLMVYCNNTNFNQGK